MFQNHNNLNGTDCIRKKETPHKQQYPMLNKEVVEHSTGAAKGTCLHTLDFLKDGHR